MHSTANGNGDRRLHLLAQIEQWQALIQIPENVELRQNKYLNNLALAGPSLYQAINKTRHGIPLVQYSGAEH